MHEAQPRPTRFRVGDGFLWLNIRRRLLMVVGFQLGEELFRHCLESLILAQDERWRRA